MARSLNHVMFEGNAGSDPTIGTYGSENKRYARFNLAVSQYIQGEASTMWLTVMAFEAHVVSLIEEVVKKGSKQVVVGELQQKAYEKDGVKQNSLTLMASSVVPFASMRNVVTEEAPKRASASTPPRNTKGKSKPVEEDDSEDVPF